MKEKKLWVYEFCTTLEGEEAQVMINAQEVSVLCERKFFDEVVYYEVEGRHKGVGISQFRTVLDTDSKRVKKVWLEKKNDSLAKSLYRQYLEETIDFYSERISHLKEISGIVKTTGVQTI